MRLAPGTVLDRYTVEDVLGEGGMAVVYRVRHSQLGSVHAMKVLKLPTAAIRDRLLQEGRVQAQLRHPNIVSVTDVVDVEGSPGLVMEFIGGSSLDGFLDGHKLTLEQADDLARGILEGVAVAHHAGLIHRDLKPANILLGTTGGALVPKITDFGLAKLVEGEDGGGHLATRSGMSMGTPAYMAPEQIESAKGVDQRADVFSLGAILYELVAGERPFVGSSTLQVLNAVASGTRKPLSELAPDLPERMRQAIDGALQVDPDARVPNCDVLLELWTGEGREARTGGIWDRDTVSQIERAIAPPLSPRSNASDDSETYYPGHTVGVDAASQASFANVLPPVEPTPSPSGPRLAAVALGGGALALALVAAVGLSMQGGGPPPLPAPEPIAVVEPEPDAVEPAPVADTDARSHTDVPSTVAPVRPGPRPVSAAPVTDDPAPEPEPAGVDPVEGDAPVVDFLSDPPGATVQIDGLTVGTTPLTGYAVPKGRYKVTLTLGDATITEKIGVNRRSGRRYTWSIADGSWIEE